MILDRHKIEIMPVSEQQYWRFKGKQKLTPKRDEFHDVFTGYGVINQTISLSAKQLAKEINSNYKNLILVNRLIRPKVQKAKESSIVHFQRKPIYTAAGGILWNSVGDLERTITRGGGIDLILSEEQLDHPARHKLKEEHYYRILPDNKIYLVQMQIPAQHLYGTENGSQYTFSAKIGGGLDRFVATHMMPSEFISLELEKRRKPRRGR